MAHIARHTSHTAHAVRRAQNARRASSQLRPPPPATRLCRIAMALSAAVRKSAEEQVAMACSICLEPLQRCPVSGAAALPDTELARLVCGHLFHALCALDMYEHAERHGGGWPACPNCRMRRGPRDMKLLPLSEVVIAQQDGGDAESSRSDITAAPEPMAPHWDRFFDGAERAFWVRSDLRFFFFEDDGSWTLYQSDAFRRWWHCEADPALWFFEETGAQSL